MTFTVNSDFAVVGFIRYKCILKVQDRMFC